MIRNVGFSATPIVDIKSIGRKQDLEQALIVAQKILDVAKFNMVETAIISKKVDMSTELQKQRNNLAFARQCYEIVQTKLTEFFTQHPELK
jgi:hypothetical protein